MRPFTWTIIVVNVAFALWLGYAVLDAYGTVQGAHEAAKITAIVNGSRSAEYAASGISTSTAIGVVLASVLVWTAVDVILGVLWLVTRPRLQ